MKSFRNIHPSIFLSAILFLVVISYLNTLHSPLILDDRVSFIEIPNVHLNDFSFDSLKQLAKTRFGKARLIPIATFALNNYFSHGNIVHYHITNIIIHLLTTIALFFFLKGLISVNITDENRLISNSPVLFSLCICAAWALHPVQTNAVTYLVQRMTSLATLFYLSSLACYVEARQRSVVYQKTFLFCGTAFFAICAFLSKEISVTLPLIILLIEFTFFSPGTFGKYIKKVTLHHWLIFLVVVLILLPLFFRPWDTYVVNGYRARDFDMYQRVLTEFRVVSFYISLLMLPLPSRLNIDHDFPLSYSSISPITTLTSFLFLVALLVIAFTYKKKHPLAAFGVFWFFINLILESTIIPIEIIFEHRLYLPSIGFFISIFLLAEQLVCRFTNFEPESKKRFVVLGVVIVAAVSSILTTLRNNDWENEYTIYSDMLEKSPNKPRIYTSVSKALTLQGRFDEALAMQEKALEIGKGFHEENLNGAVNIMGIYMAQGEYQKAIDKGQLLFKKLPPGSNLRSYPDLMFNLGTCYFMLGQYDLAFSSYVLGLKERPESFFLVAGGIEKILKAANKDEAWQGRLGLSGDKVDVYIKMADILMSLRMFDQAKTLIDISIKIDGNNPLAQKLLDDYERSVDRIKKRLSMSNIRNSAPFKNNVTFRVYISVVEFIINNYPPLTGRAMQLLIRAGQIAPESPFIPVYRIRSLQSMNLSPYAEKELEKALTVFPDFPPLLELGYTFYTQQGEEKKAFIVLDQLITLYPDHPLWKRHDFLSYKYGKKELDKITAQLPVVTLNQ